MGFRSIEEIDAWQRARAFKIAVYALVEAGGLSRDFKLRDQLREAAAAAPSQISEGFGRFDPVDFARFVKMARGSIHECRNHLIDAVDRHHITEETRGKHDALAEEVLKEIGGLLDYLQSPEATRNAARIRRARFERRRAREPHEDAKAKQHARRPRPEEENEHETDTTTDDRWQGESKSIRKRER